MRASCRETSEDIKIDGTLFLTDKNRLVFVTSEGLFSKKYERNHFFYIKNIQSARLESRFLRGKALVIDWYFSRGDVSNSYCYEGISNAEEWLNQIRQLLDEERRSKLAWQKIKTLLSSKDIVRFDEVAAISKEYDFNGSLQFAKENIAYLLGEGTIEGIIDENKQTFISKAKLDRERIVREYKIDVDFSSLRKAIEEKGLTLQVIECPSCGGKVKVPESGKMFECEYCHKNILATGVFDKFKTLLGL